MYGCPGIHCEPEISPPGNTSCSWFRCLLSADSCAPGFSVSISDPTCGNNEGGFRKHIKTVRFQVQDSVCLVTGSAQGLGKAFALRLLTAGARSVNMRRNQFATWDKHTTVTVSRVCISDVREEGGLATLKELREKFGEKNVTFVQCDVTKPEQFTR